MGGIRLMVSLEALIFLSSCAKVFRELGMLEYSATGPESVAWYLLAPDFCLDGMRLPAFASIRVVGYSERGRFALLACFADLFLSEIVSGA